MVVKSSRLGSEGMIITLDESDQIPIRGMSICALVVASGLAIVQVFGWDSGEGTSAPILYFLVFAFLPGTVQIIVSKF